MNTREIITELSSLVKKNNPELFWEEIKTQNKSKKWSITPVKIEFKNGLIIDNSEDVRRLVEIMKGWCNEELKQNNIEVLNKDIQITRVVYDWFSGSRKQITKKFDEIKKNFTSIEKEIQDMAVSLKSKQEELLEKEYQKRALAILTNLKYELENVKKEYGIELNINLFSDFIATKRKTKVLTEKGALTKKIKDEIKAKIKEILEPILKEREAQKLKEQDLQKLTLDLQDINTNSLFIEELEKEKEKIKNLLNTVELRYPNAIYEANTQLKTNIHLIEANIAKIKFELQQAQLKKEKEEKIKAQKAKEVEIKQRVEQLQNLNEQKDELNTYKIPLKEIEVIANIEFKANSEKTAKEKILQMFAKQLEFINLIKG